MSSWDLPVNGKSLVEWEACLLSWLQAFVLSFCWIIGYALTWSNCMRLTELSQQAQQIQTVQNSPELAAFARVDAKADARTLVEVRSQAQSEAAINAASPNGFNQQGLTEVRQRAENLLQQQQRRIAGCRRGQRPAAREQ